VLTLLPSVTGAAKTGATAVSKTTGLFSGFGRVVWIGLFSGFGESKKN